MTRPSNDAPWSSRRSLLIGAGLLLATGWLPSVRGASADVPEPMDAAAFAARRRWIRTPFGRIACMQQGEGPAALFLHGFPLSGFQWRHAIAQLSPSRRCIAPDFMGLGHSRVAATQDLSPQAQSNMLAALLDELSIPKVDLVANDSGGTVAQLFAVQHPQRVRTMLLTNCDVHENSPRVQMKNSLAAARAGTYHQKIARHLQDRQYARSAAGIDGSAYVDPAHFSDEAIEYSFRPLVSSPLRQRQLNDHLAAFEPNPLVAIEAQLQRSTIPTRMVWGTADPLFPGRWAEWLHQSLPASRGIRWVKGGRLFWPEEQPALLAEEARALWSA